MNQETNDFLKYNLLEAHNTFNGIISEMQEANISYEYELVKQKEMNSFQIVNEFLTKMYGNVYEYNNLMEDNKEYFDEKYNICAKYIALYAISIVFIAAFHGIFNTEKMNDLWHYVVGLFLGSTYMGLLSKDLIDYKNDTKEKRDLINHLKTMKEEYRDNHNVVVHEIDYIFALNDHLWEELDEGKKMVKNK